MNRIKELFLLCILILLTSSTVLKQKKIPTLSKGKYLDSELIFIVNGEELKIKEIDFNTFYTSFIKEIGAKGKNLSDWDRDFINLKNIIKKGQRKGQFLRFNVSHDRAISITSDMPLSNEQAGKNSKGKGIKPGIGSSFTGVKRQGARMSTLMGGIGQFLARTYHNNKK
jgi:hypothetical protein